MMPRPLVAIDERTSPSLRESQAGSAAWTVQFAAASLGLLSSTGGAMDAEANDAALVGVRSAPTSLLAELRIDGDRRTRLHSEESETHPTSSRDRGCSFPVATGAARSIPR